MIFIYKIMNLRSGAVFQEEYLFRYDAEYACSLLEYPRLYDIYEEERKRLRGQSVNIEVLFDCRKNDRLTIHNPRFENGCLTGEINHRKIMKLVVYDEVVKIWRAVACKEIAA